MTQAGADQSSNPSGDREEFVDFRQVVSVLLRWWREIVVIAVALALVALVGTLILFRLNGPQFDATADVAIVRTVSDVNFDARFTTTSDETTPSNVAARRNALVGLVKSGAIAPAVIAELGDQLNEEERNPALLTERVRANLVIDATGRAGESDLIRITARADTAQKAAEIATAWARAYVLQINQIYGQTPDALVSSIQAEQSKATAAYDAAQADLETAIANSRVDSLQRQVDDRVQAIRILQQGEQALLEAMANKATAASTLILDAVYGNRLAVFQEKLQRDRNLLEGNSTRLVQVIQVLSDARTLRTELAAGSVDTAGALVALRMLRLQAFTQSRPQEYPSDASIAAMTPPTGTNTLVQGQPIQVQVNDSPLQVIVDAQNTISLAQLTTAADALIAALEAQRDALERELQLLGTEMVSGADYTPIASTRTVSNTLLQASLAVEQSTAATDGASDVWPDLWSSLTANRAAQATIATLEQEVQLLKAELETEQAHVRQLTDRRDLSRTTLQSVSSKVAELTLAQAAASSQVRFAAPATAPIEATNAGGGLLAAVLGGLSGLLLGVVVAFLAELLGRKPILSRS